MPASVIARRRALPHLAPAGLFLAAGLAAVLLGGCASSGPTAQDKKAILEDLSETEVLGKFGDDVVKNFEVKDQAAVPSVKPSAKPSPAPAKPKGKKPKAAPSPEPSPVPVYTPRVLPPQEATAPLRVGEKQRYQITYLGIPAGELEMELLPMKVVAERSVFHSRVRFATSRVMSLMYRMEDVVESFFDAQGLFSYRYELSADESGQTRRVIELLDSEKKQTHYWNRFHKKSGEKGESRETFAMPEYAQDVLSAFYYIRTQASRGPEGSKMRFPVVNDGKTAEAEITILRREMVSTPLGKIPAVVLQPITYRDGARMQKEDSFLWISEDERRILLKMEARVKIGTVLASIQAAE